MSGKSIRMERIIDRNTGRAVIVPMDHGISMGPVEGLVDMKTTIDKISQGGATAVVLHKGVVPYGHRSFGRDIGLIVHLSASTSLSPDPNSKVLVTTVQEAIKMGADAVSIHVNIGASTETDMLHDFGNVARECNEWGLPLMVMIYPRGKDIKNGYDVDLLKQCARAGMELGADIVKTSYTGDIDSFREVVKGAIIPVVIAGGPKMSNDRDLLQMVKDSVEAGGKGVSIGRNVFQHRNVAGITRAIADVVLREAEVDEALKNLE
ncbi:2-amino-3,7-dideoxy-D-threo-hept-6-ulosonate synthase [Methanomassiliicoccus luminyensis]|uniref:2-amino-3,7-dideoxy-D-threo-hept-6-ulosonate synthase n=1 Tax=Methanomassiliicoccus luminyensis TaxID=1080712 RepID=UPI000368EC6A|nr:2-amino-3,7-dideoxy-D-threo-hept-6-ulosonate synthase [Methanomassiliicoccus luminyensis]